jgi:hypothetical protein
MAYLAGKDVAFQGCRPVFAGWYANAIAQGSFNQMAGMAS